MPWSTPSPHSQHRHRRFLSAVFCGAALMLGLAGCDRKPETPEPQKTALAEPAPDTPSAAALPSAAPAPPRARSCAEYRPGVAHQSRKLTAGEIRLAQGLFGDRLDLSCARIDLFPAGKNPGMQVAAGEKDNIELDGNAYASADYSREGREKFGVFIQGLTYLWQNQTGEQDTRGNPNKQYYDLDTQYSFEDYGWQQQADIMEDYALRFLHPSRHSRWLPHDYGGDRSDTDPVLQSLVEDYFPAAREMREAYAQVETRAMTPGEAALIRSIFGDALKQEGVSLNFHPESYTDAAGTTSSAEAADFWGKGQTSADFSREKSVDRFATFVHELTHVWQFQTDWQYTVTGDEDDDSKDELVNYKYPLEKKYKFSDYGVEQQAAIIEDYARHFLHPAHEWYYLPLVYGEAGARAKEGLLMKVVEDQFPAAKQARLAFAQQHPAQPAAEAPMRFRIVGGVPSS